MTPPRISYSEVRKVHPQHQGIYSKNGVARSIIFSIGKHAPYPDKWIVKDTFLDYSAQSSQDNLGGFWNRYNIPLRRAMEERQLVRVFEKESTHPVTYLDHGEWSVLQFRKVKEPKTGRETLRFYLSKEPYDEMRQLPEAPVIAHEQISDDVGEPPARYHAETHRIIRDTAMATKLKQTYRFRCQVCGTIRKDGKGQPYAEAHHVKPLGHPHDGPDSKDNLVVLCPNHHADFDLGAIAIDAHDGRTIMHKFEKSLDGTRISLA